MGHAQDISLSLEGKGKINFTPLKEIRSLQKEETDLGIIFYESGNVPVVFMLESFRPQDRKQFTTRVEMWFKVSNLESSTTTTTSPIVTHQTITIKDSVLTRSSIGEITPNKIDEEK